MRRWVTSGVIATFGLAMASIIGSAPANAQASGCERLQGLLQERQKIVASLNSASNSKRKLTPTQACSTLGRLVSNGSAALKFVADNKDWCQIPDSFAEGLKADNQKAAGVRNQACNAAKQQAQMMKRAQQQAQQGAGNPFGGADALTGGGMRIPQGAL